MYNQTFFQMMTTDSLESAAVVVPLMLELIDAKSVVDVGCGLGAWLRVAKRHGIFQVLGIDGDYVDTSALVIDQNEFLAKNLALPLQLDRTFDLALCLEVAEHLPSSCAHILVDSLVHLAPAVVFSAAIPGQPGIHHVNARWPSYWEQLFAGQGFVMLDPFRPLIWQDHRVAWWYQQNCYLFVRSDVVETDQRLRELLDIRKSNRVTLINEDVLAANLSLTSTLRRLLSLMMTPSSTLRMGNAYRQSHKSSSKETKGKP